MGDAQSAQRQDKEDAAAAEEESGKVDDAQTQQDIDVKPLKNNGQISEIKGKADGPKAKANGQCVDEIVKDAVLSPGKDVSKTENPPKEEETTLLKNVENNEKMSKIEDVPLEMIELNAKQNDINEGFRRFFRNIGVKLTVKRGSNEESTHDLDETIMEEHNRPEDVDDTTSKEAGRSTDVNKAPESQDNDSTTCPTLTDATSEDLLENAKEETAKATEEAETGGEDAHQDASSKEEHLSASQSSPEEEVVVSPIKRFFTTGIFSGIRKKKKAADDEMTEKELVDMEKKEEMEPTVEDQQQDKEETSPSVNAAVAEAEHKENDLKEEILSTPSAPTSDEGKSSSTDPSVITVIESHILSSQEKDKVQASPLKKLLSGSSFKRLPRKQRSRRSSDAKLSDSGEHVPDQLLSSTESAENQKEEGPPQPSAEAAEEEEGAWASFIKLLTPKKRMKRPSLSHEETQIPSSEEEPKPSEGEQISDQSTEEGKKRKDSTVSWEAVLCGSGRRRSRKTSDSEDETPDKNDQKPDDTSKHVEESPKDSCNENENENENEILASSQKQTECPSENEGTLTWKSLKKLLTPKRRAKNEDEIKDNIQPESEVTQDESSFSIKKFLPGRKKQKPAEKQDQISSDEADKDVASGDEDSETPAVVPLSEFDTAETEVSIQTQADIESHTPEEANSQLQQDLLEQTAEPVPPCDSLHTEAKKVQENDSLEKPVSATPAKNEGPDDLTESMSKHQQLSDIPEEGVITETTPASVAEEAAKDDTIAEDLIEITSEAITAPEPASDFTIADETEMVSAVSQLSSESSKTSGNATPVPVESDIADTDRLLNQVVETISISPEATPVCSDELSPEKMIGSVSQQTSETLKDEPTVPEIHTRLDETAINTGLNVDAATSRTESISEVIDSVSTEVVSEVPTEEFDTAEMAPDDILSNITHPEESLKELDSINESHPLMECLSETNTSVSTDLLLEDEKIVPDVDSLDVHQVDTEPLKTHLQDADLAGTVEDEIKDEALEQEVQIETEKENITDQIPAEDKDRAPAELEKLQELAVVQATTSDSQEGSVQVPEEDVKSAAETFEPKKDELPPAEVCVEQDEENKLKTDAAETELVPEPEASEAVPASTMDSEKSGVQVPSNILPEETATDEPKETAEHFPDVGFEPECKELPVSADKTEQVEELEVIDAVPPPTVDSEEGGVNLTEKEVKSEDILPAETVTEAVPAFLVDSAEDSAQTLEEDVKSEDISLLETVSEEPKKTADLLNDVTLEPEEEVPPVSAVKTELDSEEGNIQSTEENVTSQDIAPGEPLVGEGDQTTEHLTKVCVEPDNKELQVDVVKTEPVQEPEVRDAVPAPTVDPEEGSVKSTEEEVESEEILPAESVSEAVPAFPIDSVEDSARTREEDVKSEDILPAAEEPKTTAEDLTDVNFEQKPEEQPVIAPRTEHVQGPDVVEAVPAPTLDSEEGGVQSTEEEIKLKDIPSEEPLTGEDDQTTEHLIEVCAEPDSKELQVDAVKTEPVQEPEVKEAISTPTLDSEKSGVQMPEEDVKSEDILPAESVSEEPKKEAEELTDVSLERENKDLQAITVKTEPVQESEVKEAEPEPILDSEGANVPALEEKVTPEDIPAAETVTEKLKEEILPLTEVSVPPEKEAELETDAAKSEHGQIPETSEAVPAPTIDSEEGSVQSTKEEVKAEDISPAETVTEEPKETTEHLTDVRFEPEDKEPPVNAVKTEQVEEEETEAVPVLPVDSGEGSVQMAQEDVKSEDISSATTVSEEPEKRAEHLSLEPEEEVPLVDVVKNEPVQEPEVIEAVPVPTLDSEVNSVQSLEKEILIEDVPKMQTVTDELKEDTTHLTEVNLETVDSSKPEPVQELKEIHAVLEPEVDNILSLENKVKSEDFPAVEIVTAQPKQENDLRVETDDKQTVEAAQTEPVQEPEVLPSNVKDTVTESESKEDDLMPVPVVTESTERSVTQEPEETILSDNISEPDTTSVTTSVADKTETEASPQLGEASEITEDQKSESVPQDVQTEQRDCIPEAVDESQTLTELHTSSINGEASNAQVLGQTVHSEETSAQCIDNAVSTDEPEHEVNLRAVQVHGELEKESELPGTEIKTAEGEHAVGAQVVVCNLKDVSDPTADILIEKTSEITEPLIETMASEHVLMEESEAAAPLVKDFVTETAEESSEAVLKNVPSVTSEEDPGIQAQVVDVEVKTAETTVESMLEVGIVETKEVLDACQETVEKVDNLTLIPETEEELITEENKVTIQEVTQHVLENLQETVPESLVVNLEEEVTEQLDEVAKVSEMVESESNGVQDQKALDDSTGPSRERQEEAPADISDDSAADRPLTEDSMQKCHVPGLSHVTINDHKEDLEETEAEQERPEEGVAAEEVKSSSTEVDKKKNHEQARVTQISQSPTGTPSNGVALISQNTGIISSRGNLESPSSLSLELKLNIQFAQVKVPSPVSTSPTTERTESDVSEFRVEVVEAQSQIQPELTKAAFKSTEITEPATTTAIIITQPVLLDVGIQAETAAPAEQIKATEKVAPSNQSTGSTERIQPAEKTEASLSQPVPVKACVQETKPEEPAQTEKENDQDVWTDAEEVIYTQEETKVSTLELEEPQAPQTESEEQQKAGPGHEVETTPESKTEEEESQQEVQTTGGECDFESEGEVFAFAVEELETATVIVTAD